jgi:hypothetical protein
MTFWTQIIHFRTYVAEHRLQQLSNQCRCKTKIIIPHGPLATVTLTLNPSLRLSFYTTERHMFCIPKDPFEHSSSSPHPYEYVQFELQVQFQATDALDHTRTVWTNGNRYVPQIIRMPLPFAWLAHSTSLPCMMCNYGACVKQQIIFIYFSMYHIQV